MAASLAQVTTTVTFTDSTGAVTDPTTITLSIVDPAGTTYSYTYAGGTVTKVSIGVYRVAAYYDVAGMYVGTWYGANANLYRNQRFQFVVTT